MSDVERQVQALVIGNSHIMALKWAYDRLGVTGAARPLQCEFICVLNEPYHPPLVGDDLSPAVKEHLLRSEADFVVSMLGGNDHNSLGLVNHPRKFDLILPTDPGLPRQSDAEVIPYGTMKRVLADHLRPTFRLLRLVKTATRKPLYHLESPPPIPSEDHIKRHPVGFGDLIEKLGVAPAALRYKLWRLHSEIFRETCERHRVRFVAAPREMQDEQGMLIEQAWNPDPTHGNIHYGYRLYHQLSVIAERRFSHRGNASEKSGHDSISTAPGA